MFYNFYFRTGCYDCINTSNLQPTLISRITCRYEQANCTCHNFVNPNPVDIGVVNPPNPFDNLAVNNIFFL